MLRKKERLKLAVNIVDALQRLGNFTEFDSWKTEGPDEWCLHVMSEEIRKFKR